MFVCHDHHHKKMLCNINRIQNHIRNKRNQSTYRNKIANHNCTYQRLLTYVLNLSILLLLGKYVIKSKVFFIGKYSQQHATLPQNVIYSVKIKFSK